MSELGAMPELAWSLPASVRVAILLLLQPAWYRALGPLWAVAAVVLGVLFGVVVAGGPGSAPEVSIDGLLVEVVRGATLGIAAGLPGWALVGAATEGAKVLRVAGTRGLSTLWVTLALTTAFTLGFHRIALAVLWETFSWWPVASPLAHGLAEVDLAALARDWLVLALALATPVLLPDAVLALVAAWAGGAGLAGAASAVGPLVRAAAALIALSASWSTYPEVWAATMGP